MGSRDGSVAQLEASGKTTLIAPARRRRKVERVMPVDEAGQPVVNPYLRMSDGFDGKEDNKENQLDDVTWVYADHGWGMGDVLCDEVSAWQRGVVREDFEKLLGMIERGESAGVVFYNQDRLLRRPVDLERLLALWEDGRPWLKVASADRVFDLNDGDTRAFMRGNATNAMSQSDATSRRAQRKNKGKRARGILLKGGPRAFAWPGMEPLEPGRTKRFEVTEERLTAEREALAWAFEEVAAGGKLAVVARAWNEAGLLGFYRAEWNPITVRQVMQRQRHAGRIEHDGEVVATIADCKPTIDPELFDRVQAIFAGRKRGRPSTGRHLASGIVRCSRCSTPMVSRPRYAGVDRVPVPQYVCATPKGCGRMKVDQGPVDAVLRTLTIQRLSNPTIADKLAEHVVARNEEIEIVRRQLEAARTAGVEMSAKFGSNAGTMSLEMLMAFLETQQQTVRTLEARLGALQGAADDTEAVEAQSALAVSAQWDEYMATGQTERCREMLVSAVRPLRIAILPGERGKVPDGERVEIAPV